MPPFSHWLKRSFASRLSRAQKPARKAARLPRRPLLEQLEDRVTPSLSGGIYTSFADGTTVNANLYPSKDVVYLNGGPQNANGSGLTYNGSQNFIAVFQVTNPGGSALLSTDGYMARELQVVGGVVFGAGGTGTHGNGSFNPTNGSIPVQLIPFADTLNNGGEYKVWLTPLAEFDAANQDAKHNWGFDGDQKTDNFKVKKTVIPSQQGQIVVTKNALGPDGGSTAFTFTDSYDSGFTLNGGTTSFSPGLAPNTYTVTEGAEPAGWTYTNVVWGSTAGAHDLGTSTTTTATVALAAGQTVYVTFTDTEATPPGEFPSGIITTTSGDVTLPASPGTVTLTDTATVFNTDPVGIGGTVTFYLFAPGDDGSNLTTAKYTDVVPISGDASAGLTVSTGTGTITGSNILPTNITVTGTWNWEAIYSGSTHDGNIDDGATDDFGNEPVQVSAASPKIVTTASGPVTLPGDGSQPTISDTITMSGAYFPTGNINVTLTLTTGSGASNVYSTSYAAANTTYTPTYQLPNTGTVAGTYTWAATWTADANNNGGGAVVTDEGGTAEQTAVSPASPTLVTTASPGITLGTAAPTITDTADLEGAYFPTGTITFTLTLDGNAVSGITNAVQAATGNGALYTASYKLPTAGTVAGTYLWHAAYASGDGNNVGTDDTLSKLSAETTTVSKASPTIVTTASPGVTLGTAAPTISDSIVMSGAYFPTGTVSVTLKLGTTTVKTDSFAFSNATVTESYKLPTTGTVAGTYTWSVSYIGDGNNNGTDDTVTGTSAETTVVSKASPSLVTTAAGAVAAGSGQKMNDSALLSGGYYETGTITFKLYAPNNTVVYTDVITIGTNSGAVSGNGTYTTSTMGNNPGGYAPPSSAAAGTYTWTATYNNDGNNNTAPDQGGAAEKEAVQNGLTLGYYSNKNGQAALTGTTTGKTLLPSVYNALFGIANVPYSGVTPKVNGVLVKPGSTTLSVLVNGSGTYQTLASFQTYANVQSFLLNATATNMAYMLSAQLLTLEFNVTLGYVVPTVSIQVSSVTLPGTTTHMSSTLQHSLTVKPTGATSWSPITTTDGGAANIQAIMNAAIASLIAAPNTVNSGGDRTFQEALKDCMDGINNNQSIFI
jgi:hypothetical protein